MSNWVRMAQAPHPPSWGFAWDLSSSRTLLCDGKVWYAMQKSGGNPQSGLVFYDIASDTWESSIAPQFITGGSFLGTQSYMYFAPWNEAHRFNTSSGWEMDMISPSESIGSWRLRHANDSFGLLESGVNWWMVSVPDGFEIPTTGGPPNVAHRRRIGNRLYVVSNEDPQRVYWIELGDTTWSSVEGPGYDITELALVNSAIYARSSNPTHGGEYRLTKHVVGGWETIGLVPQTFKQIRGMGNCLVGRWVADGATRGSFRYGLAGFCTIDSFFFRWGGVADSWVLYDNHGDVLWPSELGNYIYALGRDLVISQNERHMFRFEVEPFGKVSGKIIDQRGNGMDSVLVQANVDDSVATIEPTSARTDVEGNYSLVLPPGEHTLFVSAMCVKNDLIAWDIKNHQPVEGALVETSVYQNLRFSNSFVSTLSSSTGERFGMKVRFKQFCNVVGIRVRVITSEEGNRISYVVRFKNSDESILYEEEIVRHPPRPDWNGNEWATVYLTTPFSANEDDEYVVEVEFRNGDGFIRTHYYQSTTTTGTPEWESVSAWRERFSINHWTAPDGTWSRSTLSGSIAGIGFVLEGDPEELVYAEHASTNSSGECEYAAHVGDRTIPYQGSLTAVTVVSGDNYIPRAKALTGTMTPSNNSFTVSVPVGDVTDRDHQAVFPFMFTGVVDLEEVAYEIATPHDLWNMRYSTFGEFRLVNNLEMWSFSADHLDVDHPDYGKHWTRPSSQYGSWDRFCGKLDGQGFRINGLQDSLFFELGAYEKWNEETDSFDIYSAVVKDLCLRSLSIDTDQEVTAGLVVRADSHMGSAVVDISNIHVSGLIVGGDYVGGVVGSFGRNVSASMCSANVQAFANIAAGGFASEAWDASTVIEKCSALGSVVSNEYASGFICWAPCTFVDCYSRSEVVADHDGGAFALGLWTSPVVRCYATGPVVAGASNAGFAENLGTLGIACYYDVDVVGTPDVDSLGEPRTTEEMTYPHNESTTYIGWDLQVLP